MDTNWTSQLLEMTNGFAGAQHLVDVPGMSSPRVCQLLNLLVARLSVGEHYLEIGSWKGRTLLSAAIHNKGHVCIGCDKFRIYGRYTGWGWAARRALRQNIRRYNEDAAAIHFFTMPSARFFRRKRFPGTIGVYFYDGDHSYAGTKQSIAAVVPWLSTRATVIVDDWNLERVRAGTWAGLADSSAEVLWHTALIGDHTERTWWNGLGVFFVTRR